MSGGRLPRPLGAVLALAAILYGWGLTRALPWSWDIDEITPRAVLYSLEHGVDAGWPRRYPPLQFYVLAGPAAALQAAQARGWIDADRAYLALFLVLRGVSLAMGLGVVVFTYLAGCELFGRRAGLLAAAAAALVHPTVYYAKVGNLDVPYTFWFAASLWVYLRLLARQRLADYLALAATAALAVTTKDQAYGLYALAPLALLPALVARRRREARRRPLVGVALDRRPLLALVTFAALFLLAHQLPFDPQQLRHHIDEMTGPVMTNTRMFEPTLDGYRRLLASSARQLEHTLSTPIAVLALVGIGLALARDAGRRGRALAVLLLPLSYYLTFIGYIRYEFDRYYIPVAVVLALFVGRALDALLALPGVRPAVGRAFVATVLMWPTLRAVSLNLLLTHDSRFAVERWAAARAADGEGVVAVGTPTNGQLPRLLPVAWQKLRDPDYLTRMGAHWVVMNTTDTRYAGHGVEMRAVLDGFLVGRFDYEHDPRQRFRRLPPGLWFPESRFPCYTELHSNLCLANPELAAFERVQGGRLAERLWAAGGDPQRLVRSAERMRALGRHDIARALDEEAWCLDPSSAATALGLGEDAIGVGDYAAAVASLWRAIELDPALATARVQLAGLLHALGRPREAHAVIATAVREDPQEPSLRLALGRSELRSGRRPEAVRALERTVELAAASGARAIAAAARAELRGLGLLQPRIVLLDGFYNREARLSGERYRWTGSCALAELPDPLGPARVVIDYARPPEPATLEIRIGGATVLDEACGGWDRRRAVIELPVETWAGTPFVPLEIRVAPPFRPAVATGTSDPRELGIEVFELRLERAAGAISASL